MQIGTDSETELSDCIPGMTKGATLVRGAEGAEANGTKQRGRSEAQRRETQRSGTDDERMSERSKAPAST